MRGKDWISRPSDEKPKAKRHSDFYWDEFLPKYWFNFDTMEFEEVKEGDWYHPFRWYYETGTEPSRTEHVIPHLTDLPELPPI